MLNQSSDFQGGIIHVWRIFDTFTLVKIFFDILIFLFQKDLLMPGKLLTVDSHKCKSDSVALFPVSENGINGNIFLVPPCVLTMIHVVVDSFISIVNYRYLTRPAPPYL